MCRSICIAVALSTLLAVACDAPAEPATRAETRPLALRAPRIHGGADVRLITI